MIMSVYKGQIALYGKVREELFRCTLDSGQHVEVSLTLGKVLTSVEYDGNYYPISGDLPWWTGQGFPCLWKDVIVGGGVQV